MDGAKAVKRHNAQYDVFNRLHSIAVDQAFVERVSKEWFEGRFEVVRKVVPDFRASVDSVANQRCGTWYTPPSTTYAYIKSTDGHTNNWNFNLRRANIGLAKYAEEIGGYDPPDPEWFELIVSLIIVDSTRRGKMLYPRRSLSDESDAGWTEAYFPPSVVSPSERQQIIDLLPTWTENLLASNITLPNLERPLRPFFIHPSSSQPHIPESGYTPIICLSASRWIGINGQQDDVPSVTRLGGRNVGFEYIPGAGDDDELWAKGLTPAVFWKEREILLSLDRDELDEGLEAAKTRSTSLEADLEKLNLGSQPPTLKQVVGAPRPTSRLGLDIRPPISPVQTWKADMSTVFTIYIVGIPKAQAFPNIVYSHPSLPNIIVFALPSPKIDSWAYKDALGKLLDAVRPLVDQSPTILLRAGTTDHLDLITKSKEQDDSLRPTVEALPAPVDTVGSRKTVIPIALLLLCALPLDESVPAEAGLTKGSISNVLLSLVALWPDSNPPRAALKRVNEVILGRDQ